MAQLKILICGGGIAGNALAFWLSKLGHNVTLIERFSSLRSTGLQVDLRGHAIEVMRRMGLEPEFRAKCVQEEGLAIVDGAGRQWAFFPANRGAGKQSFTTDFEIMRGDLCRLMYDAARDRVKYMFGLSIEEFSEKDDAVEVRFSNGETDRFDLVVGADGQGSRTRRMMLGSSVQDAFHPLGIYAAYFTIPRPIQQGEKYIGTINLAPGRRMMFTRRHNPHTVQGYIGCFTDSARLESCPKGQVDEEKSAFADVFQGAGWQSDWLVQSMKDADDFYCERLGVVKMDSWSNGRVALVGDAAYCPSALTGMGTSSSLVGAYILAGEIGKHCGRPSGAAEGGGKDGLAVALKAYEQKFRPFMDQVQRGVSKESTPWRKFPSTPLTLAILNFLLTVVSFLRFDLIASWLIREEVNDWALPDYTELMESEV